MIPNDKLDFWVANNMNVLLKAKHGVGKTHIITDTFNRNNLNYLYFSGSTMDPWVDFVGVPKEFTDENGVTYLDLVRPKPFAYDDVEAIFIDELNRSPAKVRNAIMELLQFKSINGKKFTKLRMIWAAVNPPGTEDDDVTYQTEEFDPAQEDRFQVIYNLPYKPDIRYFTIKHGSDKANVAINWWNSLTPQQKNTVSPRRLDLAIDYINIKGDVRDVLPNTVNVSSLVSQLMHGSYKVKFDSLLIDIQNGGDYAPMQRFLSNANVIEDLKKDLKSMAVLKSLATALPIEFLFKFLSETRSFESFVKNTSFDEFTDIHIKIYNEAALSKKVRDELRVKIRKVKKDALASISSSTMGNIVEHLEILAEEATSTPYRVKALNFVFNQAVFTSPVDASVGALIAKIIAPILVSTQAATFRRYVKPKNTTRVADLAPYIMTELTRLGFSSNIITRVRDTLDKYM